MLIFKVFATNVFWKTEDGFMLDFSDIDIDFVVVAFIHFRNEVIGAFSK